MMHQNCNVIEYKINGIIIVSILIAVLFTVQAQFTGCFSTADCNFTGAVNASNAEDCCVNNSDGLYLNNEGQCLQCIGEVVFHSRFI